MRLDKYNNAGFDRGRSRISAAIWLVCEALLVRSFLLGSRHRVWLLRLFGATIGRGVVIRPGVRVKFPWRLKVGDYSWIGDSVWVDNLAEVTIGSHCCISQGVYLCTGSHNWQKEGFDLVLKPIVVKDKAWLCAKSIVGPGVTVHEEAVLTLGSVATWNLNAGWIYQGIPADAIRQRSDDPIER